MVLSRYLNLDVGPQKGQDTQQRSLQQPKAIIPTSTQQRPLQLQQHLITTNILPSNIIQQHRLVLLYHTTTKMLP